MTKLLYSDLTFAVIGAAMEVHRELGLGFLESIYQHALAIEINQLGIAYEEFVKLPVSYKGILLGTFEADFLVEKKVVIELKAVSEINRAHQAQAMHYLAATGHRLALILNFGTASQQHQRVIK